MTRAAQERLSPLPSHCWPMKPYEDIRKATSLYCPTYSISLGPETYHTTQNSSDQPLRKVDGGNIWLNVPHLVVLMCPTYFSETPATLTIANT